jgi:hypothetical protein
MLKRADLGEEMIARPTSILKLVAFSLVAVAAIVGAGTVEARTNHALLIGAQAYPGLDKALQLGGPGNDVALVAEFLQNNPAARFAPEDVTVLADGIEGGTPPTLANIRAAFADLTAKAAPGDFIYLHFAGHGSRAPALHPETETDGLDELFLPSDVGKWDSYVASVENALVDDEIGELIDVLKAKDVVVWAVFDSCHSGTVTRGAPTGGEEVRQRKVEPASLGIPQDVLDNAEAVTMRGKAPGGAPKKMLDAKPSGKGSLIAFYAAQSTETTPEMRLPAGKKGRKSHGVFTWTIFEVLAEYPGMTYRQLGQEVLRRYAAKYMVSPTPLFDGDLDRAVFDIGDSEAIRQWPIAVADGAAEIPAGQLQQLADGDLLAVLARPIDKVEAAIGYMRVEGATALSATLAPAAKGDDAPVDLTAIPEGAYARRLDAGVDFGLTIAAPATDGIAPEIAEPAEAAIKAVAEHAGNGLRATFVAPGEAADLRLAILPPDMIKKDGGDAALEHHLWLLSPTGDVVITGSAKSPSIDLAGKTVEEAGEALADNLTRIARATNLLKLGASAATQPLDVAVDLQMRSGAAAQFAGLEPASVPVLVPGDQVQLRLQNRMEVPIDMNVLYVGSDYSITHMYAGRVQPGDTFQKTALRITDGSFGRERMIVIATPAKPQTAVENLAFLAQDAVPQTRGGPGSAFRAALTEAGFGAKTRGAASMMDGDEGPGGEILQFDFQIEPER